MTGDPGCGVFEAPPGRSIGRVLPFVPPHRHPAGEYIHCADNVGVTFIAAFEAGELRLRPPFVFGDMATARAGDARVMRRYRQHDPAGPCGLVVQLTPELAPALVEDGFVQPRFRLDVTARLGSRSGRLRAIALKGVFKLIYY